MMAIMKIIHDTDGHKDNDADDDDDDSHLMVVIMLIIVVIIVLLIVRITIIMSSPGFDRSPVAFSSAASACRRAVVWDRSIVLLQAGVGSLGFRV